MGLITGMFHNEMHDIAHRQLELRMDLAVAPERGELSLAYQQILDTRTHRISVVEALLRWNHPVRGPVSPAEFIPVAEKSGHIHAIGEWVLRTACAEAAACSDGGAESYVSVNVSAPQLDDQFVDLVLEALADTGLPAHRLMLEITESMLVDDSVNARSMLSRLCDGGVRIAIDDFGTGFSSLSYCQSCASTWSRSTDREFAELSRLGCPYAQDFLFSRPVPPEALREMFDRALSPLSSPPR